ncbi:hypothetical protein Tco_0792030 [Tanacetum coccineum]
MTSNQTKVVKIAKLEVIEEEFLEINESIYFNQEGSKAFLEQFKPVIDSPSKSRHRTMAMIINSGTTIDPITGREVKGKERMEHAKHLERMLKICEDSGLVLSPLKMKITVSTVDFLGAVIGEGSIKLQPHIKKRIVNFNEEELKTNKGLRMHRRNEAIRSSISLQSRGSSTVPLCLSEEYEDYLRRSHED